LVGPGARGDVFAANRRVVQLPEAREGRLCSWPASSPRALLGLCSSAVGPCLRPFKEDVGLVADGAPDADAVDIFTDFGATKMVAPPFKHRLAAARPTKQEDARLTRNVDLHFIHRKGASVAKTFNRAVHASPPARGCGAVVSPELSRWSRRGRVIVAVGALPHALGSYLV